MIENQTLDHDFDLSEFLDENYEIKQAQIKATKELDYINSK